MDFLVAIVGAVAGEIAKFIVVPIKRQIGYLFFYNLNIKKLEEENKKLEDKKVEAKEFMNDADSKFKKPAPGVTSWYDHADKLNMEVCQFLAQENEGSNKCLNGRCQNPCSHYSLNRKAFKMIENVTKTLTEAPALVAYDVPPTNIGSTFNLKGVKDFDSRLSLMSEILEALRDDKLSMISICGMGGVGKTTMAKKTVKSVQSEKLFDLVAITTVSQKPDLNKIQSDIVSCFGWKFDNNDSKVERARKLHQKFMESNKSSLLVFDDVWKELKDEDFEVIGLPSPSEIRGCKIILTSRKIDVCNKMGSQKNFTIGVLSTGEAWDLFKEMALPENSIGSQDLNQIARQVAAECCGLPIALVTVAKALKNKHKRIWEDALLQLENSNSLGILGMEEAVYSRIELSYDLLGNKEAKSCFLLCCLFYEDFDVPIELLVLYGMGLRLFQNVYNIQQARRRVLALIDELKESFLLLESDEKEYVRMHDLVHDAALSIASKDEHAYFISCENEMRWPETNRCKDYKAISLFGMELQEHPVHLDCPKLDLLQIYKGSLTSSQRLPDSFLWGMKELKVLALFGISVLPQSLNGLKKLRTLCFGSVFAHIGNLEILGDLGDLEILRITSNSLVELPKEIGLLRNLRLLDLSGASWLAYFPSGVLPKLSKLEELYVNHNFNKWESNDDDGGRINASLRELQSFRITTLHICVSKPSFLPEQTTLASLERFNIRIGDAAKSYGIPSVNNLYLNGDASDIKATSGYYALLRKTEELTLDEVENLKIENFTFPLLRKLTIWGYDELKYLVDINRISISRGIELPSFSNLRDIEIKSCDKLRYVFPLSMARRLTQLQRIHIEHSSTMQGIFCGKEMDDEVELPNLISLKLRYLPKLIGLWVDMDDGGGGFLPNQLNDDEAAMNQSITYCKEISKSESVEQTSTSQISYQSSLDSILFPSPWIQFSNLQKLTLDGFDMLEVAFPVSVAEQLVQLKFLWISMCWRMAYVVASSGIQEEKHRRWRSVFPMLKTLSCQYLPELMAFCADSDHVFLDCYSLKEVLIIGCQKIEASMLFGAINEGQSTLNTSFHGDNKEVHNGKPSSMIKGLIRRSGRNQQKKDELDNSVRQIQHVPSKEHQVLFKISPDIGFLNIQKLQITNCDNLVHLFSPHVAKLMVMLETISIENCEKMEEIVAKEHEEAPESTLGKIAFPQLREITLFHLQSLESFYGGIYAIEFPLLGSLYFDECNQMKTFSLGSSIITPILKEIIVDGREISLIGDLNTIVKEVMARTLRIHDMEHVLRIGHDQLPEEGSSKCLVLHIKRCGKLLNAIPSNFIARFQDLEKLIISMCNSLEEIFEYEGENTEGGSALSFSRLEEINLKYLQNLQHVFTKIPKIISGFQNLRELHVSHCNSLRNILSISVARGLLHLQLLQLNFCNELNEVVEKEDKEEEEASTQKIVFPQLRQIDINLCPRLQCFCSGNYALEFPLLESLLLHECDYMKTFSHGSVSTPMLKEVTITSEVRFSDGYGELNGDLNAIIREWFNCY